MTKASFPSLLVVTGNGVLAYKFSGKTEQLVVFFFLYIAERRGDNIMSSLAIVPQGRNPFDKTSRNSHLVTVTKRMRCRNHRFHQRTILPGDALNNAHYAMMLDGQLFPIGYMGNLASSALIIYRTLRLHPVRGLFLKGYQLSCGIGLLSPDDSHFRPFPWQCPRYKYGKSVHFAYTFSMNSQIGNGNFVILPLHYRAFSLFIHRLLLFSSYIRLPAAGYAVSLFFIKVPVVPGIVILINFLFPPCIPVGQYG